MLLEHTERSVLRNERALQYLKTAFFLFAGVCLTICLLWMLGRLEIGGKNPVYAVGAAKDSETALEVQAGLMGVINGVSTMESYSEGTRVLSVSSQTEVLAGASGVDKRMLRKAAFSQTMAKAKELGYCAQQTVWNNQMSSQDYYTLLQIVEAEATGGDLTSKMMVAGVVLIRVQDTHFPDSVYEVVYETAQFQPTTDGRMYSCTITDSTIEAVDRVLAGEDYSQGALFFVAREAADVSKLSWFDSSLIWLFEYGGHDYYTYAN